MISQLTIQDLITYAYIGVSDVEKQVQQQINWQITFHFTSAPVGCQNDDITSTICYDHISSVIAKICLAKKYNLLESLCLLVFEEIKKITNTPITVSVIKQAPASNMSYRPKFTLSDASSKIF
jgi:dihydroneopterin aldolase